MGKKRISQLLDQLQANHQADIENAATIFTVAQVAVNQLEQQVADASPASPPALPPALIALDKAELDKAELMRRYGSFNACRKAAGQVGIRFHGTPTWAQLIAAFSYFESLQSLVQDYMLSHPNPHLNNVSMEFKLDQR
ncbi:hypothetical protein J5X98_25220 [Leptothermofonsia sichuanensis E412]|uniref:hypothetical protein n=1 Tax=Leptothermofonsia sichuanensis TaxID=2917832 RepID=UPI001CA68ADB|nr:hypothetical protein [Leptothermofonsia sichuanensis]QZZ20495.1 hypothetical protein J5X98_25220 [Leptothermofonsia sichuanensis E412]